MCLKSVRQSYVLLIDVSVHQFELCAFKNANVTVNVVVKDEYAEAIAEWKAEHTRSWPQLGALLLVTVTGFPPAQTDNNKARRRAVIHTQAQQVVHKQR